VEEEKRELGLKERREMGVRRVVTPIDRM